MNRRGAGFVAAALLATAVPALAQLSPEGGTAPLPSNNTFVATPPPPSVLGWTHFTLPRWLSRKRHVVKVRHGTEIFRVQDYRIGWNTGAHIYIRTVHAVGGVEHSDDALILETVGGNIRYPADASFRPIPGEYTLVFYAPNQQRSPLLRYEHPIYVVP